MENRIRCITCNQFLIAQNGLYFHPEIKCSGLKDYIFIEATIEDKFLHDKFVKLYGKPDMNDYELLKVYEDKIESYRVLADKYEERLSSPVVQFIIKIMKRFGGNK